jgi:glycosyltransferase involved in cell wall biosynthesis
MNRLRVGIDAHMVGGQETGNETYVTGLIAGFEALGEDLDLSVLHVGEAWAADTSKIRFQRLLTSSPYVRLGLELPIRSLGHRLDLLHTTYAAPLWSPVPIVLTVHDICYTTNPEWFSRRDLRVLSAVVPWSMRRAAHVITDSSDARSRIIETYSVPEKKITAIPIGPGPGARPLAPEEARQALAVLGLPRDRPFLLTVGNLQPRKNLTRLIEAYTAAVSAGAVDADLVIVGPRRFRAGDVVAAATGLEERIHLTGYISDRQLAACYSSSAAFILPSLYEGFGLPVLEAMTHGTPVACSNAGALPEVCGDAALMFDPTSVDAIAAALTEVLREPTRRRLQLEGRQQVAKFSWSRCAGRTLNVYREATGLPLGP